MYSDIPFLYYYACEQKVGHYYYHLLEYGEPQGINYDLKFIVHMNKVIELLYGFNTTQGEKNV